MTKKKEDRMASRYGLFTAASVAMMVIAAASGTCSAADEALRQQIAELRARVVKLEAALDQQHQGPGMQMGGGGRAAGMGTMGQGSMPMEGHHGHGGGMPSGPASSPAMGMNMGGMGAGGGGMSEGMDAMEMMGRMPGGAEASMPSALPGFPGVSHLYHVGATGFFIDHAAHIALTAEQQTTLGRIREKALSDQATTQRSIDTAEQELWALTASDQPDAAKIESKAREAEKLRTDQRLAFIRAVGEAARVLTDDQRRMLLGQMPPASASSSMPSSGGMGGGAPQGAAPSGGGMDHM